MANLNTADRNALEQAARLIETKGWTKGAPARDAEGRRLDDPKDGRAVCFCTLGALCAAVESLDQYDRLYEAICGVMPNARLVWIWNDYEAQSAEEVTSLFRLAAKEAA